MKFVELYIVSVLVWSILLNYYQHMQNRRRQSMKNETLVISISLLLAPATLILVLSVFAIQTLGKLINRKKIKVMPNEMVGEDPNKTFK